MGKPNRVCVIYSGGLDSTCLVYKYLSLGHEVLALSFRYGQRHAKRELCAARDVVIGYNMSPASRTGFGTLSHRQTSIQLGSVGSLTGSAPVPEGHYAAESMKSTVVPYRNLVMLATAASIAKEADCSVVAYGAHKGDHDIYPDCRTEFIDAVREVFKLGDWDPTTLAAPYAELTKHGILSESLQYGVQVPYADTWSCYNGGALHCGRCGTCVERKEAFELAGIADPTIYEEPVV